MAAGVQKLWAEATAAAAAAAASVTRNTEATLTCSHYNRLWGETLCPGKNALLHCQMRSKLPKPSTLMVFATAAYPMKRMPSKDSTTFGWYMSCSVSSPNWWSSLAPQANTTDSIGGFDTHRGTSRQRYPTGESGMSTCPNIPLLAALLMCCTDMLLRILSLLLRCCCDAATNAA